MACKMAKSSLLLAKSSLLLAKRVCVCVCQSLSCVQLFVIPWTIGHQAPLTMEFSRQEYWSQVPFPSPGDLPNPGIKSGSSAFQADSLPSESPITLTFNLSLSLCLCVTIHYFYNCLQASIIIRKSNVGDFHFIKYSRDIKYSAN